ncbi:hypothetical protein SAMN05880557_108201 [Pseudacidovorax sp. RU35E]|nr:hypothetical protein SAMN05880557_108201 [Pseudacidovorax sp. RU35E]
MSARPADATGHRGASVADGARINPGPDRRPRGGMWGWPLVFGISTAIGLVSSLFSDGGFGDWLGWLTLGAPVVACLWWGWLRR